VKDDEVDRIETPGVGSISAILGRDALAPVPNRPTMNDVPTTEFAQRVTSRRGFARIRVERLAISYDTPNGRLTAMEDISFNIEGGEILCLVGPSGCGKSSLLNALSGFIAPAQCRIEVDGCEVGWSGLRRGVVFQEYALFPWRTARRNVEFGLEVRGLAVAQRREIGQRALEEAVLTDFADFYPHRLSGGTCQHVAVARALAFDPDLMLMDEPFAALDEEMREELQGLVIKLWREIRKTFVYVTRPGGGVSRPSGDRADAESNPGPRRDHGRPATPARPPRRRIPCLCEGPGPTHSTTALKHVFGKQS
jgi:ABC-type nitrate/sulfonate/bicarbonate transport system ATPase subunit